MKHSYVEKAHAGLCTFPAASHFVTSSIIHMHFVHFQYFKLAPIFRAQIDNEIHCQLFFMIGYQFNQSLLAIYFHLVLNI